MIKILILFLLSLIILFLIRREYFIAGVTIDDPLELEEEGTIDIKNRISNRKIIVDKIRFNKTSNNDEEYIDYERAKYLKNVPILFKEKMCLGDTCVFEKDLKNLKKFFPQGTIIPWVPPDSGEEEEDSGEIVPPPGWVLCDGKKTPDLKGRTPDLTDLFIRGKSVNGQEIGGNNNFVFETKHLPEHSHGISIAAPAERCFGPISESSDKPVDPGRNYESCPVGSAINSGVGAPVNSGSGTSVNVPKNPQNYNLSFLYNDTNGKGDQYPLASSAEGGKDEPSQPVVNCNTKELDNTPRNKSLVYIMKVDNNEKGDCYLTPCNLKKHYKSKCKENEHAITYTNPKVKKQSRDSWKDNAKIKKHCFEKPTFPKNTHTFCAGTTGSGLRWKMKSNRDSLDEVRTVCKKDKVL